MQDLKLLQRAATLYACSVQLELNALPVRQ